MSIPASAIDELAPLAAARPAVRAAKGHVWRRLRRHRGALFGIAVLATYAFLTAVGPAFFPYDPTHQVLNDARLPPSSAHWLGTDQLGRDELVRLIYGARYSLTIGLLAVLFGLAIGVPVGAISGYFGGWVDLVLQRFTDILLSFPGFLLALSLVAVVGVGLRNVIIAVGISAVPSFVRLVRASALSVKEQPFVESARAVGVPARWIVIRYVVANSLAPVIVQATLYLGSAILVAAGLGFLGLGVQPPTPEWGSMLGDARNDIFADPNLATFPGLAIFLAVLAFNLLGDGLRDALDPRLGSS
jgi:ABC-type dipeptide/oligopeptide/nickel transport system permease subunit